MRATPLVTAIRSTAVSGAINSADGTVCVSDTSTQTLPDFPQVGEQHTIKATGSGKTVTIDGNSHKIDGGDTLALTVQYSGVTVQWDGTTWHVVAAATSIFA